LNGDDIKLPQERVERSPGQTPGEAEVMPSLPIM
jgi:hypothetical protein